MIGADYLRIHADYWQICGHKRNEKKSISKKKSLALDHKIKKTKINISEDRLKIREDLVKIKHTIIHFFYRSFNIFLYRKVS